MADDAPVLGLAGVVVQLLDEVGHRGLLALGAEDVGLVVQAVGEHHVVQDVAALVKVSVDRGVGWLGIMEEK